MLRIFGPMREEVMGGWRRLLEELHNLYTSGNIIRVIKSRRMKWAHHVACMRKMRNVYKILIRKPEGKRMYVREALCEGMDWIHVAQDRDQWWFLVNMVMNLWVP